MSYVNLSAAVGWVHAANKLPNLRALYLSNCGLNSSIPSLWHHNLTVLEKLDLSGNPFNSLAAPNWYWDVTSLKILDIDECELSGSFPDELGNLTMLKALDMGWNKIEGMIPATLNEGPTRRSEGSEWEPQIWFEKRREKVPIAPDAPQMVSISTT